VGSFDFQDLIWEGTR